jgi:hypothetical protein
MEPVDPTTSNQLQYHQNHISFRYSGYWFSNPDLISYEYKLENIDRDWIRSKDQFATYSSLGKGTYEFKVRTGFDNQFRNTDIITYRFQISAPFWQTAWFYFLAFITLLGSFGLVLRVRLRQLKRKEEYEKEKYKFQFESLRSQINPHFLFNSFNTLISLIEENREMAAEFAGKLSDFFRNILQLRDKELITLREELNIMTDYYYLLKERYGANFKLDLDIPEDKLESFIPPLTLQMLVENALKHNITSRSKPLKFEIYISDQHIIARNNIQLKKRPEYSTKLGLQNILRQYRLIAGREVVFGGDDEYFKVSIPIITNYYEHPDN